MVLNHHLTRKMGSYVGTPGTDEENRRRNPKTVLAAIQLSKLRLMSKEFNEVAHPPCAKETPLSQAGHINHIFVSFYFGEVNTIA
jgi:hypothetical protein